jgi:hypothetical protein
MWTKDGDPTTDPDPNRFVRVHSLSAGGEVFSRIVKCRYCQQQWLNAVYPVASEGWRPVRTETD